MTPGKTYRVPPHIWLNRTTLRPIFRGLFHILSHVQIFGREHIPASGPYVVAINHISLYEPPFILAFWPRPLEAVGAVDIWKKRGQSSLARLYGGFQVHRGEFDRQVVEKMILAVHSGYPLLIAPEGGRSHTPGLRRGQPGVAYLLDKTQAPLLPVGLVGTTEDFWQNAMRALRRRSPRPRLEMRIGEPFRLPPVEGKGAARRQVLQANADLIMLHIAALLPEDYRGLYANQEYLEEA